MTSSRLRLAVLFSGGGSTLQNLIDATADGRLPGARVVRAVSSRADAGGVARCAAAGVRCAVESRSDDAAEHSRRVFSHVSQEEVDVVCLAGWMSRLVLEGPWLDGRVLNVHPSLLPAFGGPGMFGRRVHEAVLERGCRVSGCTVHAVNNEIDAGPILDQRCVPVAAGDDVVTLAARVQAAEREAYVDVLRRWSVMRANLASD
jgi:phosphoribosylglycinamide formyltransferase-1